MNSFISPDDEVLAGEFLDRGYVVRPAENVEALDYIRSVIAPHESAHGMHLNTLRMQAMLKLNLDPLGKSAYFSLARNLLESLVGNELAMQKSFNLSVQTPDDGHDLLPIHACLLYTSDAADE